MSYRLLTSSVIALLLGATHSAFARPFHHPFGELREYHKHWLAICPDKFTPDSDSEYETTCWASTFTGNPDGTMSGGFPGYRLSVSRNRSTGEMNVTFVGDSVDAIDPNRPVIVRYSNGQIREYAYGMDVTPNRNSGNEYTFTQRDQVVDIIKRMKRANHIRIVMPLRSGMHDMQFSTIGLRNALRFTEKYASHK